MQSTLALLMVNAMLAMASPMVTPAAKLEDRDLKVVNMVKTETVFVYPDGSPASGYTPKPEEKKPVVYYHHEEEKKPEPKPVADYGSGNGGDYQQPSTGSPSYADPGNDFVQNSLYHHNVHRANHSAPDVTWDSRLERAAQELANTCNYGHNTDLEGGGYGQNIAMKYGTAGLGDSLSFIRNSISSMWYGGELPLYGQMYGGEPSMSNFHEWGHFTQVVWKSTEKIGCAVAECGNMKGGMPGLYSVCNYEPAGNFQGQYGANVAPPGGMAPVDG